MGAFARGAFWIPMLVALGCFDPRLPANIGCPDGACPPGFACGADEVCRENGSGDGDGDGDGDIDASPGLACVDEDLGQDFGTASGTTVGAGNDWFACGGEDSPDVAYSFTAPNDDAFVFDTCGSNLDFDTVLGAFDGCSPSPLVCNDDFDPCDLASRVVVSLSAGQTIVIVVDGLVDAGDYVLNVSRQ